MRGHIRPCSLSLAALLAAATLAGCGTGVPNTSVTTPTDTGMSGKVIGGQQPVSGATILLYAAGGGGYGTASTAIAIGTVTTDGNGSFTLPAYTCPLQTSELYLVARNGNPGLTGAVNNTASTIMAVLGPCNTVSGSTHVTMNELTTVSAVWALAPFMTSYANVAANSATATGLVNAFAMAATPVSSNTGQLPGAAPAGASLPLNEINTLGNVIASCINTSGSTAAGMPCASLFSATTVGGSVPTDTIGAALNIALHPGTNVSNIYALVNATGPFQPTLTASPNDWTIALAFPLSGPYSMSNGNGMAIDVNGNVWIQDGALQEVSPTGTVLISSSSMMGTSVALDAAQNVWASYAPLSSNYTVSKMSTSGGTVATYHITGMNGSGAYGLAIDSSANVWYTCTYCEAAGKLTSDGAYVATYPLTINHDTNIAIDPSTNLWFGNIDHGAINVVTSAGSKYSTSPFTCTSCADPAYVAIDSGGNAWTTGGSYAVKFSPSGGTTNVSPYTGGLSAGQGIAIDGASNVWIINNIGVSNKYAGDLAELTATGAAIAPTTGYVSSTMATPYALAIDGSGNVWTANTGASTLTVFIGVAAPVVTPLALALANGTLATKP